MTRAAGFTLVRYVIPHASGSVPFRLRTVARYWAPIQETHTTVCPSCTEAWGVVDGDGCGLVCGAVVVVGAGGDDAAVFGALNRQ